MDVLVFILEDTHRYKVAMERTFLIKLVVSMSTSVSWLNDWIAPRYPMPLYKNFGEDMTSTTWKDAHDMSYPSICSYR